MGGKSSGETAKPWQFCKPNLSIILKKNRVNFHKCTNVPKCYKYTSAFNFIYKQEQKLILFIRPTPKKMNDNVRQEYIILNKNIHKYTKIGHKAETFKHTHISLNALSKVSAIPLSEAWKALALFFSNHLPISYPNKVYFDTKFPKAGSHLSV